MSQYLAPGVYVEEAPAGPAPIQGASTSTAAFLGELPDAIVMPLAAGGGPIPTAEPVATEAEPILLTNWGEFQRKFGGYQTPELPLERAAVLCNAAGSLAHAALTQFTTDIKAIAKPDLQTVNTASKDVDDQVYDATTKLDILVVAASEALKATRKASAERDPSARDKLLNDGATALSTKLDPAAAAASSLASTVAGLDWTGAKPADKTTFNQAYAKLKPVLDGIARAQTVLGYDLSQVSPALVHAVRGFFDNGGSRVWVVRLASFTAPKVDAALTNLEAIDDISIVAAPGATGSLQGKLLAHCEKMKERFAILDSNHGSSKNSDPEVRTWGDYVLPQSAEGYGATYYPWITVYDPASGKSDHATSPSGHIAGVYARIDAMRGVFKAPANAVIQGITGVEQKYMDRTTQGTLNEVGINVLRNISGNPTIWGARTLGGSNNGEWRYVNVRRLMIYLSESIENSTRWAVFEPNNEELWAKIKRNVSVFLTDTWRSGALFGDTAADAFFIRCDESNNPKNLRDLGQVNIEIGVAIVRPAEFVVFTISQMNGA
jgi:phage tail sheath protein FI